MSTELTTAKTQMTVKQRAVVALGFDEKKEAELRELAGKTTTIVTITNKDGYTQVHNGRMALKNRRLEIQSLCKEARDEAIQFSKAVIAEEKRLIEIISPEEQRLQAIQDAHDAAIEAEKQARIDAELQRVQGIQNRIEAIRSWPANAAGKHSSLVSQMLQSAMDYQVDIETFQEFTESATTALANSRAAVQGIHAERVAHEAEQERIKAERAELELLRAEQVKREIAERTRMAEEERQAKAERDADNARQAAILRSERLLNEQIARDRQAELDRQAAEQKAIRDTEEKRIAGERAELERQRAEDQRVKAAEAQRKGEQARIAALKRPSDTEMIDVLAAHYVAPASKVAEWLSTLDVEALQSEAA